MTAGRKPKPAALKELTGRDHHGKKQKAVALDIDVKPSEETYDFTPSLRDLWNSLSAGGVVKFSDRRAFQRYEHLYAIYISAAKDVIERGQILNKGQSNERYNPSWRIMRDAHQELMKLEAEFGLTPSSKRRILQPIEAASGGDGGDDYASRREAQIKERESRRK